MRNKISLALKSHVRWIGEENKIIVNVKQFIKKNIFQEKSNNIVLAMQNVIIIIILINKVV